MSMDPSGNGLHLARWRREDRIRPALRLFAGAVCLIALLRPEAAPALDRKDCMVNPMFCTGLIQDNPNDVDLRLLRAAGYQAQKQWDKAVDDYSAAIAIDPDDADLHFRRGRAQEAAGRLSEAHADYLDALNLDPRRMEYALSAERSICSPQDFDRALKIDPNSADAYLIAGMCSQRRDHMGTVDLDRAERAETRAIALKPDFAAAYYNRALLYVTKRNYGRALADLDSLQRIDPDNADVHTLTGVIRGAQGDLGAAVREHGKAIVADPLGARRYLYRAWALFNAGRANAALVDANRAMMLAPAMASAYETRGRIEQVLGDKILADLDFERARLPDSLRIELAKPSSGPPPDNGGSGSIVWMVVAGIVGLGLFMFLGRGATGKPPGT
jgi:tetratricopeptide (TPR) repeat protein